MQTKSIPLSVRISQDDADFIAGLKIEGAKTPSDKVRSIIANARKQSETIADYSSTLELGQDFFRAALLQIKGAEHHHEVHSQLISRVIEWLPEFAAFVRVSAHETSAKDDITSLKRLEKGVTERLIFMTETLLQMAISDRCTCYDPRILDKHIRSVLDLAILIKNTKDASQEISQ
jgi:hypothetical protein